jgi:hypothetical protein
MSGNTIHLSAGPAVAMVDGNNSFTGDNRYSEICTAGPAGTTIFRWVQKTQGGCATISATAQPVFGLAASTASNAAVTVYRAGRGYCAYNNTAVLGNWATVTADGRCSDSGVAAVFAPPAGAVAVAEASGAGNVLVSIWPAPSTPASAAAGPVLLARTVTTTVEAGGSDVDSVATTIAPGGCIRVSAFYENLTGTSNPDYYLNLGSAGHWLLQSGSGNPGHLYALICNAAGVQNAQVVHAAVGVGPWYGNALTIKASSAVDTSTAVKISISANAAQQVRLSWTVERLY